MSKHLASWSIKSRSDQTQTHLSIQNNRVEILCRSTSTQKSHSTPHQYQDNTTQCNPLKPHLLLAVKFGKVRYSVIQFFVAIHLVWYQFAASLGVVIAYKMQQRYSQDPVGLWSTTDVKTQDMSDQIKLVSAGINLTCLNTGSRLVCIDIFSPIFHGARIPINLSWIIPSTGKTFEVLGGKHLSQMTLHRNPLR